MVRVLAAGPHGGDGRGTDGELRMVLAGCVRYAYHLSIHRYGSHVLQTALEGSLRVLARQRSDGGAGAPRDDAEETEGVPPLGELVVLLSSTLREQSSEFGDGAPLGGHLCGSHVLRSLLLVLAGASLKSTAGDRRGRLKDPKKKKKKVK